MSPLATRPPFEPVHLSDRSFVRWLTLLASGSSGFILLIKAYGLGPMHLSARLVMLPCMLLVAGIWIWAKRQSSEYTAPALLLGFWGGLIGTVGYDVSRVPFLLLGRRVFAPISAYGVWLCDAPSSSALTEWVGWLYHFSNGATFGMMYGLVARRRHWLWAVAWAMLLETMYLVCPLGRVFSIAGNYSAMGVAYLGHVAYGVPLGWILRRWDLANAWTSSARQLLQGTTWTAVAAIAIGLVAACIDHPRYSAAQNWTVAGKRLSPDWLRIERGGSVVIHNGSSTPVQIAVSDRRPSVTIAAESTRTIEFSRPGVFQVQLQTPTQSRSSFVIVEPAEELP